MTDKYIIVGPFNASDSGALDQPYKAQTADNFDLIMRRLADLSSTDLAFRIHIGPGTFYTRGQRHNPGVGLNSAGSAGWDVRSNWTISGAGEAATTIVLEQWPNIPIATDPTIGSFRRFAVVGSQNTPSEAIVSGVTIENLTVDGRWDQLTNKPASPFVALSCLFFYVNGPITFRNVAATGMYGNKDAPLANPPVDLSQQAYAIGIEWYSLVDFDQASRRPIDPLDFNLTHRATFDSCTVHHGSGDYCVGISSMNAGPTLISRCTIYSLANGYSGAIQVAGKDIVITRNFIRDCYQPFYVETGDVIDLDMDNNRFISNGPAVVRSDSSARPDPKAVWINVRKDHIQISAQQADPDFDGVYVDVPIRPLSGSGAVNPLYRIRLWLSKGGSENNMPPVPAAGIRVKCPFQLTDTIGGLPGTTRENLEVALKVGLDAYYAANPSPVLTSTFTGRDGGAVRLDPTTQSEWIYHSQGAAFAKDESKIYVRSWRSWTNWRIRSNYFEIAFIASTAPNPPSRQSFMDFTGNGSSDKDYHVSNNLGRFTGNYQNIPTYSVRTNGIGGVAVMDNVFDADTAQGYGKAETIKVESQPQFPLLIDTLTKRGNRNLYEKPIQTLLDDFHDWGSQQTLSLGTGQPLSGSSFVFAGTTLTGTGTNFQNELVVGDLVATGDDGEINGVPGPFSVQTITSQTLVTLSQAVNYSAPAGAVKRYRGAPASGVPLPGTNYQFVDDTHIAAQGVDFRDELRPGDLLATDRAGALGHKPGPFYVVSVESASSATLSRMAAAPFGVAFTTPVRRYRGPIAYLTNPTLPAVPQPIFNVMNDGSVAIGGIPTNFGFGEFYLNGKATITGQVRVGEGSPSLPALSFLAEPGTGFFRPVADAVGLVTSGVERARVTSAGLQLGNAISLGFGISTTASDTFLVRDDGASVLALRNGTQPQTFRVYENYGSLLNYSRLSFKTQAGNYQIRTEASGTGTLRSLQVGTGPRTVPNQTGLDTIFHAGQGTGTMIGGAILFQYSPAAGSSPNGLQTAWQIGNTGHLTAGDAAKMIKWGTTYNYPALKAISATNPELQIRRGDDMAGAALLFRLSVAPKAVTTYPLNESESNRTFTNEGATVPVAFVLPPGSTTNIGFHCHFAVVVGLSFTIRASDNSTIRVGNLITVGAPPGSINTSALGNTIHLVCTQLNKWVALSHEGTWNGLS